MKRHAMGLFVASSLFMVACVKGTTTTPSGPACRTYATAGTHTYTGSGTASMAFTQQYDAATNRLHRRSVSTAVSGSTSTSESVTAYQSVADFVGELAVIPPLNLATGVTRSGSFSSTTTNEYDAQRRLTRSTIDSPGFAPSVTTYTAWDASGRPTAATNPGQGFTVALTWAYDDATRTTTATEKQTQAPLSPLMTYTQSYTADGEPLFSTDQSNQDVIGTRTTTITSTAQVCK